eukprot:5232744-Prymnesium_polylepis.1
MEFLLAMVEHDQRKITNSFALHFLALSVDHDVVTWPNVDQVVHRVMNVPCAPAVDNHRHPSGDGEGGTPRLSSLMVPGLEFGNSEAGAAWIGGGTARWAAESATASAAGVPEGRARGNGATRAAAEGRLHP